MARQSELFEGQVTQIAVGLMFIVVLLPRFYLFFGIIHRQEPILSGGKSIEEVLKTLAVSKATFHRWRNQYGGMKSEEGERLKELEGENALLKRLLAEAELDKSMLKEAFRGND